MHMLVEQVWSVKNGVDEAICLRPLQIIVIWEPLLRKISLKIFALTFEGLVVRDERQRERPSDSDKTVSAGRIGNSYDLHITSHRDPRTTCVQCALLLQEIPCDWIRVDHDKRLLQDA